MPADFLRGNWVCKPERPVQGEDHKAPGIPREQHAILGGLCYGQEKAYVVTRVHGESMCIGRSVHMGKTNPSTQMHLGSVSLASSSLCLEPLSLPSPPPPGNLHLRSQPKRQQAPFFITVYSHHNNLPVGLTAREPGSLLWAGLTVSSWLGHCLAPSSPHK